MNEIQETEICILEESETGMMFNGETNELTLEKKYPRIRILEDTLNDWCRFEEIKECGGLFIHNGVLCMRCDYNICVFITDNTPSIGTLDYNELVKRVSITFEIVK
jgi:hypothetical protein